MIHVLFAFAIHKDRHVGSVNDFGTDREVSKTALSVHIVKLKCTTRAPLKVGVQLMVFKG
ncbi:MAG: hypothetical protein JW384_00728 [Nitrosomonadaceae bacterium]|nr:hypothetical protein [Nitrosomonadaceae bacterium]